jgi:acyl-[acyl carrier protein]--UDP-N-acetylglucosamine O-acyltransferase
MNSVIDPSANIHESVKIGPFCMIGPNVTIGPNCVLHSHVVIKVALRLMKIMSFTNSQPLAKIRLTRNMQARILP